MNPMERPARFRNLRRERGFSLMEVLIAMLVLAIGLLGLASLQAQSLKFNHESYVRSQATILAYEIMDRMRTTPSATSPMGSPSRWCPTIVPIPPSSPTSIL